MTIVKRLAASLMLTALLSSCVKVVEVPVMMPRPPCPLKPDVPDEPHLSPGSDGHSVTLPWTEARDLGIWIRDNRRERQMARVCLEIAK